jgi:hypothetical protein
MKIFMAGNTIFPQYIAPTLFGGGDFGNSSLLKDHRPFILESFYYCDDNTEKLIPLFGDFMLDSGAFTFISSMSKTENKSINWEEYTERYADFINRNNVKKVNVKDDTKFLLDRLNKRTIVVDFDNTVTEKSCYPVMGKLAKGCKEKLEELKREGYRLVLYTARQGNDLRECMVFCKKNELPFDDYIGGKFSGAYYIDDKAIKFSDWQSINIKEEK